jgi:hypothetical protein
VLRRIVIVLIGIVVLFVLAAIGLGYWLFSGDGVRVALEQQATSWLGQPVTIGRARAHVFPRAGIQLADVQVGRPARLTLASVQLSTDFRALLSRQIRDGEVTIGNSRIQVPLPFDLPESEGGTESNTTGSSAIKIVSIRAIALDDIRLVSRGREIRVSANSALDGDRLTLRRFRAESGTTTLDADGEVDLATGIDARVKVTANKLDVDELLALADAFTPPASTRSSGRQSSSQAKIAARVSAETATAGGIEVRQFATDVNVNGDRVALSPLTFQLFGGRYQGSLNAQLGQRLALTLRSTVQDVDVAQLAAFGGSPNTVSGTLSGTGTFSGQGTDVAGVLSAATGTGTATIVNGTIRHLNLLRTVVLFFGRPAPDAGDGTDRFDRMEAGFSLANRVFRADPFALRSPDADLAGSGTLDVASQALAGTLQLALSEELSKQAGTDLIRFTREGNRVVLPAKIGGTISAPRVVIDAAAAAQRGLRNEMERRLKGILGGFGSRDPNR